jgi:hypothetical protein
MARTKTKYRAFRDGGRVDLPIKPVSEPSEAPAPVAPSVPAAIDPPPAASLIPPSSAIPALQAQLDALLRSEALAKQQQQPPQPQHPQGDVHQQRRIDWVKANPLAQKHHDQLGILHGEALQAGLADMSPDYLAHMENRLAALEGAPPMAQATPKSFAPPPAPAPRAPAPPMQSSLVSAPVSREIPGSRGRRPSGQIKLTREEVEAAAMSGLTVEEYARQKQKYQSMLTDGSYRDNREQR